MNDPRRNSGTPDRRPGSILIAVMVIVLLAALMSTSLLFLLRGARLDVRLAMDQTASQALARSGLHVVLFELSEQRQDMLQGQMPELAGSWTLFESSGRRGVARLLSVSGQDLVSEATKVNLNHATEQVLTSIDSIDTSIAQKIIQSRSNRPFFSVAELLRIDGVTPELVYGEDLQQHASAAGTESAEFRSFASLLDEADAPLVDLLTVYSFDPNVQSGFGDEGYRHVGRRRINLNRPWSEALGEAIADRYDQGVADAVQQLMAQGREFTTDRAIVEVLLSFTVPPEEWVEVFDVFTTTNDLYRPGRIDLNHASPAVLATVPGVDREAAELIVARRELIDDELRRSVVWPVIEGILTPQEFAEAVDQLTTRSAQYRVFIETGVEVLEDALAGDARSGELESLELEHRRVYEAVIDLAAPQPRIAYLRDVTMFDIAARLYVDARDRETMSDEPSQELAPLVDAASPAVDARAATAEAGRWQRQRWVRQETPNPASPTDLPEESEFDERVLDSRLGRWTTSTPRRVE